MPSLFSPSSPDRPKTRRWSSAMPQGPPPPSSPEHRRKPPRLSFHKSISMTNVFEPQQQQSNQQQPTTPARKMRNRLSSFLTTSPISLRSSSHNSLDKLTEEPPQPSVSAPSPFEHDISSPCSNTTTASSSSDDFLASPYEDYHVTSPTLLHSENAYVKKPMGLAQMVQTELGCIMEQVDEEIEQEWEHSRRILRQSLSMPVTLSSGLYK
ncbi:hypothetical protein BDB00DRAFT_810962 [Zychaea mexicana]|uniref:uncharacterized protein n=1 Tax=Zychaea mexicana TaxID=64656 RepID=UPI0022FDF251|nr:uncharacterized protein BDB00DRAFT_810962 [Zychaea mexicana]KAI9495917.1 hypothetical protein BDB00DRAFT_810962 [Zychaea mexicana]